MLLRQFLTIKIITRYPVLFNDIFAAPFLRPLCSRDICSTVFGTIDVFRG